LVFFLVSWAAVLILFYFNVQGGENSQLTLYRFGEPIYLEGKIQPVGIIYKLIDPVLFCALFSTFLFTKYQLNSKEGVNNE
jgi:F0F1-type ATP synthase assembly protein I